MPGRSRHMRCSVLRSSATWLLINLLTAGETKHYERRMNYKFVFHTVFYVSKFHTRPSPVLQQRSLGFMSDSKRFNSFPFSFPQDHQGLVRWRNALAWQVLKEEWNFQINLKGLLWFIVLLFDLVQRLSRATHELTHAQSTKNLELGISAALFKSWWLCA